MFKVTNVQEFNRRILKAISMHQELLNKELSYSEDLQNKETIARHRKNIETVKSMLIK